MEGEIRRVPVQNRLSAWDWAGLAVVLATAFFMYRGALNGFFVQDDFGWLDDSRFSSLRSYLACFFRFNPALTYRPLSQETLFWLCQTVFGMWPTGFHMVSMALHLLSAVLVFMVLRTFFGTLASVTGTLFFAVHSAHFRSVYWISAAPEPMALVFYLAGVLCFILFDRRGDQRFYWLCLASMALGLMSKESILTLPAVLAVYSLLLGGKRLIFWSIPCFAGAAAYWMFRMASRAVTTAPYPLTFGHEAWRNLLTYLSWTGYFSETLLRFKLKWAPESSYTMLGLLVAGVAIGLLSMLARNKRVALFALLWFVFALQPVLYFSQHIFPYYLGPALPAFSLLLASAVPEPKARVDWKPWLPVVVLAGCVLWCSHASIKREGRWWNERSFIARNIVTQMPEVERQIPPGHIAYLCGFGPVEFGAMQNDAALKTFGYPPDRFILVGLDRDTRSQIENLKLHGGLNDYYCFLYSNGKLQNYSEAFRNNPDSFLRLIPLELLNSTFSPGGPSIRLEPAVEEVTAGSNTLSFRILNLNADAIDVLYTLNGGLMPVVTNWKLDRDHAARVFVGPDTPKGTYQYRGIRDTTDPDFDRWFPVDAEIIVR